MGKPINGDGWITLENESVIDATVLEYQHRKSLKREQLLSFEDVIFYGYV